MYEVLWTPDILKLLFHQPFYRKALFRANCIVLMKSPSYSSLKGFLLLRRSWPLPDLLLWCRTFHALGSKVLVFQLRCSCFGMVLFSLVFAFCLGIWCSGVQTPNPTRRKIFRPLLVTDPERM